MGASESKLVFKQGIFRLSEPAIIPANDPYWTGFWQLPESVDDVFSLFSSADVRRARDKSLNNLETLISAVTSRLLVLRSHPSFPDAELAPASDALNCIRILTRILPFIYEAEQTATWEDNFFWTKRKRNYGKGQLSGSEVLFDGSRPNKRSDANDDEVQEVRPLGEELIDTLVDFLFFSDFTLPKSPAGKSKVSYAIWQTGVGCNTPVNSTKEFENNRAEVLRLLLTLASKSMYLSPNTLPLKGVKAITYITTSSDKQMVLSVLCSLLNTTLKYNPATWRVPYDHVVLKDSKQVLVSYCLQLLLVLVIYPIPKSHHGLSSKNAFRHFLGRLHRPQDFQFLVDGMTRILNQPLQASAAYLPGSHKALPWAPELIMLFWEVFQWNKRFRSFIVDTDRAHDFIVLTIFYAMDQRHDPSKHGLVRMCVFVLQSMSTEPNFGKNLNKTFEGHESLPANIKEPNFNGTYADYLIASIHNLIMLGKGKLDTIYPALLAILSNIAAYVRGISQTSCDKLIQLFAIFSSTQFLFLKESNHQLLHSLLEAFNAIIEHQKDSNPKFLFAIFRFRKRFQNLRELTLDSKHAELYKSSISIDKPHDLEISRGSHEQQVKAMSTTEYNAPSKNHTFAIGDDEDDHDEACSENDAAQVGAVEPDYNIFKENSNCRRDSGSSSAQEAVPVQLRGMSEKARGKMPVGHRPYSMESVSISSSTQKESSVEQFCATDEWVEGWLAELPLRTILLVIAQMQQSAPERLPIDSSTAMAVIRNIQLDGAIRSSIRIHLFEWSSLAIGWYESLLWGFIFTSEILVPRGISGAWNGTHIRLFKVQETAAQVPSILSPRGAVDAVGSNLIQRIGTINLRGSGSQPEQ